MTSVGKWSTQKLLSVGFSLKCAPDSWTTGDARDVTINRGLLARSCCVTGNYTAIVCPDNARWAEAGGNVPVWHRMLAKPSIVLMADTLNLPNCQRCRLFTWLSAAQIWIVLWCKGGKFDFSQHSLWKEYSRQIYDNWRYNVNLL